MCYIYKGENNIGVISYYKNKNFTKENFTKEVFTKENFPKEVFTKEVFTNDNCAEIEVIKYNDSNMEIPLIFYISKIDNNIYELKYAFKIGNIYKNITIDNNVSNIKPCPNILKLPNDYIYITYINNNNILKYALFPICLNLTFIITEI
jgi:hypothetical protein